MHDLVLALSRAVDKAREGIGEPVWTPLEALLPAEWCDGWMFMGAIVDSPTIVDGRPGPQVTLFAYKHGITRKYLHIGADLNCYRYRGSDGTYVLAGTEAEIERVYEDIATLHADRTTPYDDEYIAARNARLIAAGFRVVG